MPFFAKDDISAVHAPNAGVVHLDSHHDYDDARDDSFLAHKPLAASINRRFDHTEPPHEVFDDTSSTDSSTRQPHMDGNLPQALPNGVQSSRSHSAMLTNGGAGNPLKPAVDGMQHPTSVNGTSSISYSQQHQQPQSSGRVYPEFSHLRNSGPPQGIREDLQAGASSLQTRSPAAPTHAPPPVPSVASMVPSDSTNPPIPGGLRSRHTLDVPRPQPGRSSLSKENNNARKAKELRQMIKAERPVPVGETMNRMPDILEQTHTRGLFYSDDGGIRATHEDNQPAEEIYYLGVIDCLTHYGVVKKFEHFWKGLSNDRTQISARPPHEYGERFLSFMTGITMSSEEAARDAHDREAAAIANPNAGPPIPSSPSYLPPAPPHMRSPGSPEPNPVVEKVLQVASRADKDSGAESQLPERKISTSIPLPGRTSSNTILPVVEESVEGSSSGVRPYTPQERADGYTDLAPGGFGGRGPPTPPKSSYVESAPGRARSGSGSDSFHGKLVDRTSLDKALPPLPR